MERVWKVAIVMIPGDSWAAFLAQMWTGVCQDLFGCGEFVEGAGCPHEKHEFSSVVSGHFLPLDGIPLLAKAPFSRPQFPLLYIEN